MMHSNKNTLNHEPEWFNKPYRRNGAFLTVKTCLLCVRANGRASYAKNPEHHRTYARRYRRENPEGVKNARLERKFGITLEIYNSMLNNQGGIMCYM